ncbi:MAG: helix-turn-helix domain-containing protein, partial [Planctomycetes bacterium]|nr:helix-turn-helix domain-containing protein [Planctomycetota bacterium]
MNLGVREAAELLSVSEKTIYRWVHDRSMPVTRIQDQFRFNRVELMEWAISHRIPVSPDIFREPESKGQPLPSLSQALSSGGILYRVEGNNRDDVLRNTVTHMNVPDGVDRDYLFAILQAREELG